MQGNRATQKFGLVRAFFFSFLEVWIGGGVVHLLQPFTRRSPFAPFQLPLPHPHLHFQSFRSLHHNVPTVSWNLVPPVSLLIGLICVLSVTL